MRHLLALLITTLLAVAGAAAQPFPQNSQGLVYNAFTPTGWATLSVTDATSRVALGSTGAANTPFVAWVHNIGSAAVNVVLGKDNTVVATLTTGTYIASGQCVALNALGATYLAALTPTAGVTTLKIMTGTGVPNGSCAGTGGGSNVSVVSPLGPTTLGAASVAVVFGSGATLPDFAAIPTIKIDQTTPGTTNGVGLEQIGATTVAAGNGVTGAGSQRVTIASDNAAVTGLGAGATGAAVPANAVLQGVNVAGNTTAVVGDPCQVVAKTSVPISQATDAVLFTLTSLKKNYICSFAIFSPDAESVSLVEGTGSTCDTGTAAIIGGTTAANGLSLAANSQFAVGSGAATIAAGTTVADVCLLQSGSGRIAGVLTYVQL